MERRLWVQSFCISALHDAVVLCDSTDFLLNFAASSYIWNDTAMDVKFVKILIMATSVMTNNPKIGVVMVIWPNFIKSPHSTAIYSAIKQQLQQFCLSVCLSHAGSALKRLNCWSSNQRCIVA